MEDIRFYPCLTDELLEKSGCVAEKYRFFYNANGIETPLQRKGTSVIKLSDPLDMWKLKEDGITVKKKVSIAYPDFLHGPEGVACKGAELGICIFGQIIALHKQATSFIKVIFRQPRGGPAFLSIPFNRVK